MLERNPMKNITIAIPDLYVDAIETLIRQGIIPSRSEGIRLSIRDLLKKEFTFKTKLENCKEAIN